jgi:hypothetical protein
MADRRDDVDSWLSERIDPLPPPPGTFELIKRRARRRKYRKLALTATAAAVIVAAAVTVPQVVHLPVLSPAPQSSVAAGKGSATPPGGGHAQSSSAHPKSSPPSSPPSAPAPVPANFRPSSVTFIGTRTGWVIGQAGTPGHCATQYCTSVARTGNAGKTWTGVPAPLTGAPDGATGVSQIRFLNASDGWAFGPELFGTHDGGQTWTQVDTDGLRVTDLETVGNRVFALFASCTGGGPAFAAQCTSFTLYSSPAPGSGWTPVGAATTGLTDGTAAQAAALVLTGSRGYLLAPGGALYVGPVGGGGAWQRVKSLPSSCTVGPAQADGQPSGALLAAVNTGNLIVACASGSSGASPDVSRQQKLIYSSPDGGVSWRQVARAPDAGVAFSLAASPSGTVVLGTNQGIDVLPAGSTAWQAAALGGGGGGGGGRPSGGFGYVGMTTSDQGIALPANLSAGTVWFTFDGGQSWRASPLDGS